jgi:hypothetical protein
MAWDEWAQLKAAAAERASGQMQLNQLPADATGPGGGSGTLRHSKGPWGRSAGAVDELWVSTQKSLGDLGFAHDSVASGAEGLASLGALKSVLTSWEKRIESVRGECAELAPALRQVARDMGEVDVLVGGKADSVTVGTGSSEGK